MGDYNLKKNVAISIDLAQDYRNNGWSVSNGIAYHNGCNQGFIELQGNSFKVGVPNVFEFEVLEWSSGFVRLDVGNLSGEAISSKGIVKETFTPNSLSDKVMFYSDGNLAIKSLSIYTLTSETNGATIAFSERGNRFVTYYSYNPENMINFNDRFFAFKNGILWEQNVNEVRNNFFGVQYDSVATFYVNTAAGTIKDFFTMRVNSNSIWSCPQKGDIKVFPTKGKSAGMLSRLKKGKFENAQGKFFADFLRNMVDPRFDSELEALINGAELQGDVMEITIRNSDTFEVRLIDVTVEMEAQNYTL